MSFKLSVYLILSFGLALLADLILYSSPITARALYTQPAVQNVIMVSLAVVAWGLFRMYTPTIASIVCLMLEGRDVRKSLGNYLNFNRNTLTYFLLAPIIVYLAFGIFLLLSMMLGTLSIDKYVKIIVEGSGGLIKEDLVRIMIIIGLILDYPAALTINSFFALGEEIGWRGYLFELMGRRNDIRSTVIIGSVWGLWHSTAIILLGFNYPILRAAGIPLFVVFCILLTAPMLKLTTMSSSILPAVSIHGAVNALWRTTLLVTTMSETYGGLGITGIASWLITVVMILFIIKLSSGKA